MLTKCSVTFGTSFVRIQQQHFLPRMPPYVSNALSRFDKHTNSCSDRRLLATQVSRLYFRCYSCFIILDESFNIHGYDAYHIVKKIGKVEAWPVMLAKQELISKFLTSKSMVVDDVFECATI